MSYEPEYTDTEILRAKLETATYRIQHLETEVVRLTADIDRLMVKRGESIEVGERSADRCDRLFDEITRLKAANAWHSVEDGLPELNQWLLVYNDTPLEMDIIFYMSGLLLLGQRWIQYKIITPPQKESK
ncbi:MAG: hypothetical protein Q8O19_06460 [Rectinemataceae bacterium]|nr:hypothetical protein [Rectinemataceae bacterium]